MDSATWHRCRCRRNKGVGGMGGVRCKPLVMRNLGNKKTLRFLLSCFPCGFVSKHGDPLLSPDILFSHVPLPLA